MTLTDVLKDFAYLSVLLLIGFELRKRITLFQRYFIPTSLIAGTIGMFFSPSWLGEVSPVYIPFSSGIGQWSGVLVIVVCATMFLSLELNQVGRDGMATTFLAGAAHQGQMVVGLGIAALFGVLGSTLPYQFGYMGVWGFYAGHGNATTVGNIIQDAGLWNDAVGVGVTFATIGILCGVILGMVIINMGAKRGLTHVKMSFADMDEGERTGYIRPENRVSVGNGVTNVSSLDPLAFQLAIVGVVVVIGIVVRTLLMKIHPIMSNFPLVGAVLVSSMINGVWLHCGSIYEKNPNDPRPFNSTMVIDPRGNLAAKYHKIHPFDVVIPNGPVNRESERICPGDEIVTVDTGEVGHLGLSICYDMRFAEMYRIMALEGAQILLMPADFTMPTGKDHWETILRTRAIENGCYVVAPAQYGVKPKFQAYANSLVVDPWGNVIARASNHPQVITAEIDLDYLQQVRRQIFTLENRRPDVYSLLRTKQ